MVHKEGGHIPGKPAFLLQEGHRLLDQTGKQVGNDQRQHPAEDIVEKQPYPSGDEQEIDQFEQQVNGWVFMQMHRVSLLLRDNGQKSPRPL